MPLRRANEATQRTRDKIRTCGYFIGREPLSAMVQWMTGTPTTRKPRRHAERGVRVDIQSRTVWRTMLPWVVIFETRACDSPHDRQLYSQLPAVLSAGAVGSPAGLFDGGSCDMTWSAA
jgi:hypothetical protein